MSQRAEHFVLWHKLWHGLALILLLLPLSGPVSLTAYELKSQRFVPDKYYLGENVRVILEIDYPELQGFTGPQVIEQQLPSNLDYHIAQVRITPAATPNAYIIEISYALYNTDINALPAFSVDGFAIEAITIPRALSSLAESSAPLQDLGDNLRGGPALESRLLSLPWVDLSIALLIQALVLLPIILLQSSKRLRNWLHECYKHYLQKKPYRQFLRQLHFILQKEGQSPQEYYRILSSQVRYYLGNRTPYPCSAYTSEELSKLKFSAILPQGLWQDVLHVMSSSDTLRFGNLGNAGNTSSQIGQAQKRKEVQTLIEFAKIVEKLFQSKEGKLKHV